MARTLNPIFVQQPEFLAKDYYDLPSFNSRVKKREKYGSILVVSLISLGLFGFGILASRKIKDVTILNNA